MFRKHKRSKIKRPMEMGCFLYVHLYQKEKVNQMMQQNGVKIVQKTTKWNEKD